MISPGFVRCPDCGEFKPETETRYLDWGFQVLEPDKRVCVRCRCNGIISWDLTLVREPTVSSEPCIHRIFVGVPKVP
jgi:hypothetical protein